MQYLDRNPLLSVWLPISLVLDILGSLFLCLKYVIDLFSSAQFVVRCIPFFNAVFTYLLYFTHFTVSSCAVFFRHPGLFRALHTCIGLTSLLWTIFSDWVGREREGAKLGRYYSADVFWESSSVIFHSDFNRYILELKPLFIYWNLYFVSSFYWRFYCILPSINKIYDDDDDDDDDDERKTIQGSR